MLANVFKMPKKLVLVSNILNITCTLLLKLCFKGRTSLDLGSKARAEILEKLELARARLFRSGSKKFGSFHLYFVLSYCN